MKQIFHFLSLLFFLSPTVKSQSRTIDTLINVGEYNLHFIIVKGKGIPILFESGGGDGALVWKEFLPLIQTATGAPLITYDRPGFGKSGVDSNHHGIGFSTVALETALAKLNFNKSIMLVSHSQGALNATYFAFRNKRKVKSAVFVDASTVCWFNEKRLSVLQISNDQDRKSFKTTQPGKYFQFGDLTNNVHLIAQSPFPTTIPVTDFVSGNPPFTDSTELADWRRCHKDFVALAANRTGIVAKGSGHYIYKDDPKLVSDAIISSYKKFCK